MKGPTQQIVSQLSIAPSAKWRTILLLLPALSIVIVLFGGGLLLGLLQVLGYFPGAENSKFTFEHIFNVITDPDFFSSLFLTFYVSTISTILAALISVVLALLLVSLARHIRWLHVVMQIPLVIPHLVIAAAMIFLLSPSGFLARIAQALHLIDSSGDFPLFVHDPWLFAVILVYIWKEVPFLTLMILSILLNMNYDLLRVGKTLNANRWQRFRFIVLPTILPNLTAGALIVFAYSFGAFEAPYLLGQTYPVMLPVWAYRQYVDIDLMSRPEGIATGIVIAAVIVLSLGFAYGLMKKSNSKRLLV